MSTRKKKGLSTQLAAAVKQKAQSEDNIKQNIIIKKELKDFIPPLTPEELDQLEINVLEEGCRDALILWKDGEEYILVDGHNRYHICTKNKLDFKIELKNFENIDQVKEWMIGNQLGKRNLTEEAKSYFRGKHYKTEKRQGERTDLTYGQNVQKLETREKLAELYKKSAKTIQRDEKYADAIDKVAGDDTSLKWKILTREINISKNFLQEMAEFPKPKIKKVIELLTKEKDYQKVKGKLAEENQAKPEKKPPAQKSNEELYLEDFRNKFLKTWRELSLTKDKKDILYMKELINQLEKDLFS